MTPHRRARRGCWRAALTILLLCAIVIPVQAQLPPPGSTPFPAPPPNPDPLPGASVPAYEKVRDSVHNFLGAAPIRTVCLGCHLNPTTGGAATAEDALLRVTPVWGGHGNLSEFPVGRLNAATGVYEEFPDTTEACLACHDGVLAAGVHRFGAPVPTHRGGKRQPEHPVRIIYPRSPNGAFVVATPLPQNRQYYTIPDITGDTLTVPTGAVSPYLPAPGTDPAVQKAVLVRSRNGEVHCESCHNPHDNTIRPFLRAASPDLCLTCHSK